MSLPAKNKEIHSESEQNQGEFADPYATPTRSDNLTWHRILRPSRTSSVSSLFSDRPTSQISTTSNVTGCDDELSLLRNQTLDSGNFSCSESSKSNHNQVIHLNNELYHVKTELLAYKHKWNEIKNEVEHKWSKKYQQSMEENDSLSQDKKNLERQISQFCASPAYAKELELFKIKTNLEDTIIKLECKENANEILKAKLTELHCALVNTTEEYRQLQKQFVNLQNDFSTLSLSESWFKNELHVCQTKNARLNDANLALENDILNQNSQHYRLQNECKKLMQSCEDTEKAALNEKENLLKRLQKAEESDVHEIVFAEYDKKLKENAQSIRELEENNSKLLTDNKYLQESMLSHDILLNSLKKSIEDLKVQKDFLEEQNDSMKSEKIDLQQTNSQLKSFIDNEKFQKCQIEVSVAQLRANFNVLSINFEKNKSELAEKSNQLQELLAKCEKAEQCQVMNDVLISNFRKIESKNLDLEIKLGKGEVMTDFKRTPKDKLMKNEDEMKQLRILIKVIENENRHRLKRFEINNRTLLQEIKKQIRGRRVAEKKAAEAENDQFEFLKLKLIASKLSSLLDDHLLLVNDDIFESIRMILDELKSKKRLEYENSVLSGKVQQIKELHSIVAKMQTEIEVTNMDIKSLKLDLASKSKQINDANDEKGVLHTMLIAKEHDEYNLKDEIESMSKELHSKTLELKSSNDKLKLYEDSERILLDSKQQFFADFQNLKEEILFIQEEKFQLQEMVKDLRSSILDSNSQNFQNGVCSSTLDFAKVKSILSENLKQSQSLQPLEECVESLKLEVSNLSNVIRQNVNNRYQISLMDELCNATKR